jgi:hypothetical protein
MEMIADRQAVITAKGCPEWLNISLVDFRGVSV